MSMTNKPVVIDDNLNYLNILKNFHTKVQQISRQYYELNHHHTHLFNQFFNKTIKELTPANKEEMKKMLIASLDLKRKVEISGCLMDLVSENNLKLDMNVKDEEITQTMPNENPNIMSELEPNNKEIELNYIHNVLNGDSSNENKTTLTENLHVNSDSNVQTILTGTNTNIKNTTVNKNSKKSFNNSGNILSNSDSDIQPTYCICEEISYGSMVCCDNDLCPIEWFHFRCVSLSRKPKGKWYCPNCRGTNSKTMKSREIFFEELKEYNKRKEENWQIE